MDAIGLIQVFPHETQQGKTIATLDRKFACLLSPEQQDALKKF